jgi:hypothetical protein
MLKGNRQMGFRGSQNLSGYSGEMKFQYMSKVPANSQKSPGIGRSRQINIRTKNSTQHGETLAPMTSTVSKAKIHHNLTTSTQMIGQE